MEFGLREVLIGVGFLVIAGILFDGWRRMNRSRDGELEMPNELGGSCDDWEYYRGELPNGGARKVTIGGEREDDPDLSDLNFSATDADEPFPEQPPEQERAYEFEAGVSKVRRVPVASEKLSKSTDLRDEQPDESVAPEVAQQEAAMGDELFEDDERLIRARQEQERKLAAHYREEKAATDRSRANQRRATASREKPVMEDDHYSEAMDDVKREVETVEDVIVINVMARNGQEFPGPDLHRVLLSCGLRHGEMNIFHRYEQHSGKGQLLFSLANVVEPGTFDPDQMEDFTTPGVCMFLKLPGPRRSLAAFDLMMETARKVANLLGGEVKDENHVVMTQQTVEHYRQRVIEFERRQLSAKALTR